MGNPKYLLFLCAKAYPAGEEFDKTREEGVVAWLEAEGGLVGAIFSHCSTRLLVALAVLLENERESTRKEAAEDG